MHKPELLHVQCVIVKLIVIEVVAVEVYDECLTDGLLGKLCAKQCEESPHSD